MQVSLIHGPNLNLLGVRETEIYGRDSYDDINRKIKHHATSLGVDIRIFQSNHEGEIIDAIHDARNWGGRDHHQSRRVYPLQLCDSRRADGGASARD